MDRPVEHTSTDQSVSGTVSRLTRGQSNGYELYEREGSYVLSIDLPGYERDDMSVHWHDGILVVSAEHEAENPNRSREAKKRYRVSMDIDPDGIQARYRQGVLDVFCRRPSPNRVGRRFRWKTEQSNRLMVWSETSHPPAIEIIGVGSVHPSALNHLDF